jgi:phosphatidylinositol kinase/protein kinase (PI-3  family)
METITGFIYLFAVGMGVLRGNHETLMSVLESFLHDPLVEWGRSKQRGSSSLDGRNTSFSFFIPREVTLFVLFMQCSRTDGGCAPG